MAGIELKDVRKAFQNLEVIHGIDLAIADGSFTVFVGPSGCGKSTLLRMMAGLEEVTSGEIQIDGMRCDHLLPSARGMAMVFQSYALYPHMNVEQNLKFGLENQKLPKPEIQARVAKAAGILQIEHLLARKPSQLSGGQSQRVAIGRAIVKEPKAFLFDEPLSNLDAELRVKMRGELIALHRRLKSTMIYVTHDQVEAMTMADQIVVLNGGQIEQVGVPIELYARPANLFVARFLGTPPMNLMEGRIASTGPDTVVELDSGHRISLGAIDDRLDEGEKVTLGIRPEHCRIEPGPVEVIVNDTEVLGAETILHGQFEGGAPFVVSQRGIRQERPGTRVPIAFDPRYAHLFRSDGRAIRISGDWKSIYLSGPVASILTGRN